MPRAVWQLVQGRPVIEIVLSLPAAGQRTARTLLADTGAGSARTGMELILSEDDCSRFGMGSAGSLRLGGAFTGSFPAVWIHASVPGTGFSRLCLAVAVPAARLPQRLEGIACYRFLHRFTYAHGRPVDTQDRASLSDNSTIHANSI